MVATNGATRVHGFSENVFALSMFFAYSLYIFFVFFLYVYFDAHSSRFSDYALLLYLNLFYVIKT